MIVKLWFLAMRAGGDSSASWIAPAAPTTGPAPQWIWVAAPGQPLPTTRNAPAGTVWLVRWFHAPADVRTATLILAADNAATAYMDGVKVLESRDWSAPASAAVTVSEGRHVLAIEARNDRVDSPQGSVNPAGVIAKLTLAFADGSSRSIITDREWLGATEKWPEFPAAPTDANTVFSRFQSR